MFPRNAAAPEPIAIGAVIQISDGAVQTSGCTVRIKPIGVAEADGGGTTAYSTDGIVLYTPTQAETNYTSFVLIAKKTGCIPVSITVVTTASATPGKVVLSGETHTSAVIPTVTTVTTTTNLTNLPSITAGWLTAAGIAAGALDGKGNWNIGKTGYTLTATTGLGNQTADITGSLSGSVGSVTGAVGSVTAAVTVGTINANVVTASALATDAVTEIQSGLSTHSAADIWAVGARTLTAFGFTVTTSNAADVTAILADTNELQTDWANGGRLDLILDARASQTSVDDVPTVAEFEARTIVAANYATAANLLIVSDGVGFLTAVLMGACADAGTAGETYVITFGGATYTTDYAGLDSTGNRGTTTRTKT